MTLENGDAVQNGFSAHGDDGAFLFTSESVAEGHPGMYY